MDSKGVSFLAITTVIALIPSLIIIINYYAKCNCSTENCDEKLAFFLLWRIG
jgi:hypothetical protein